SVVPNGSIGRLIARPGTPTATTIGVPVLAAPASASTLVTVTSSNTDVVTLASGASTTVTVNAGERVVQLPIGITAAEGAALLPVDGSGVRRELLIVVGNPPASDIPALTAPIVGIRVGQ